MSIRRRRSRVAPYREWLVASPLALVLAASSGCGSGDDSAPGSAAGDAQASDGSTVDGSREDASTQDGPADASPDSAPSADASPPPQTFALNVTAVDTTFATRGSLHRGRRDATLRRALRARRWGAISGATAATTAARRPSVPRARTTTPRSPTAGPNAVTDLAGLLDGRRVVRVLEAADEQHRVRVGGGNVARSSVRCSTRRGRDRRGRAARPRAALGCSTSAARSNALSRFVSTPSSDGGTSNPLGWPGFWPTLQPFTSVGPARSHPTQRDAPAARSARTTTRARAGRSTCNDYECDYTPLHLPNRAAQVNDDHRPWGVGLGRVEGGALDAELPAGHARRERAARSPTSRRASSREVGVPGNDVTAGDRSRARISARAISKDFRPAISSRSSTTTRTMASPADHGRRDVAGRLRESERRAPVQSDEPSPVVPGGDRRHRGVRRERVSRCRPATPSSRPTATCSTSRVCSAPTPASTRSPTRPTRKSAAASRRSHTSTAIRSPCKPDRRTASPPSTTGRSP